MNPGQRVKCAYPDSHVGTLLALDDVRAWEGSIAFECRKLTQAEVSAHVAWCKSHDLFCDGAQPVLWDFGRVYWDRRLSPA